MLVHIHTHTHTVDCDFWVVSCALARHSIQCTVQVQVQVQSASAKCKQQSAQSACLWSAGVRSDVHQLALPRPDKWGFSGHCLRKYTPNFVRSQLDSGVTTTLDATSTPKEEGVLLYTCSLVFGGRMRGGACLN